LERDLITPNSRAGDLTGFEKSDSGSVTAAADDAIGSERN
jgi:hypothetical protein